jgi:hypothetical protein
MQVSDADVFKQIVAPAVLIPACGLLLLSSTARLNTVLARIRAFHSERLDLWTTDPDAGTAAARVRVLRLEGLEHQSHRLLRRASLLRITMLQLFFAIASNLLSAMGLVAVYLFGTEPPFDAVPSLFFGLGLLFMTGAMVTSVLEVGRILETVKYEHTRVERLCATDPCERTGPIGPDARKGESLGM